MMPGDGWVDADMWTESLRYRLEVWLACDGSDVWWPSFILSDGTAPFFFLLITDMIDSWDDFSPMGPSIHPMQRL